MMNTCCLLCLCFMSCCLTVHATGCTEGVDQCTGAFDAATEGETDLEIICAAMNTFFRCVADYGCCTNSTMAKEMADYVEQMKDMCTGSSPVSNPCAEKQCKTVEDCGTSSDRYCHYAECYEGRCMMVCEERGKCGCYANDEEHEGYCEVEKTVDNCSPYKTGGKCHWGPKEDPQCYQTPTCGDVKAMYKFDKCCGNPAGIFHGFSRRLVEDGKGSGRRLGEDDIFAEVEAKLARTLRFEGASSAKRFAQQIGDLVSPHTSTLL